MVSEILVDFYLLMLFLNGIKTKKDTVRYTSAFITLKSFRNPDYTF